MRLQTQLTHASNTLWAHSTLERDLTGSINHTHTADDITPKDTPKSLEIKTGNYSTFGRDEIGSKFKTKIQYSFTTHIYKNHSMT